MKTQTQTKPCNWRRKIVSAALITCLCAVIGNPAFAANATWNGGAVPDGNWLTPGNWNGVAPSTNDLLIFTGGTQTTTTNNYSAGTLFNNISFNSGAGAFTLNGNSTTLSSPTDAGSGQIAGGSISSASANTETIRVPIALANGNHTIANTGAGTLKLNGSITRSNGAVVTMSGNINVTGGLSTNGSANGILGGWAVFNNNWATLDASSNVIAYTAYTDIAANGAIPNTPTANVRIPNNTAATTATLAAGTTTINSLFFGSATASSGAETVAIGAGNKLVLGQNGGVFNNTAVAGAGTYRNLVIGASIAAGGTLTAGDGVNPATIRFGSASLPSAAGFCTVNASITDNGSAPVTVVVAGAYLSMNGGGNNASTNTYSGGTYILQGRVSQPGRYTFGSGPVYIVSGGQANCGTQVPNEMYIEGSGTVENSGMGVLRLYSASLANGYTGNLPGTIHLTGLANICADNIDVASQFVGISGKITGPGSLGIGSPTATTRSGVINIGSTNGTFAIANDYAGDTRINGITGNGTAGSSKNSILQICNAADNNIMPHGLTGSYAGGKTGNLILNANANYLAIFELNGSTQTINGLSSTATTPANNFVRDSLGGAVLIAGDSDATSTFGGVIQNGIVLKKIGSGTLTLSGANTYTGDTLISTGRVVTTTASTGAGNFSVSNNAALGVTVAALGQTLPINNLTFGSASSLQLNAGSFGNPTAAIVNVTGALNMNGNVNISLSGVGLTAGGPFTVMTYVPGSRTGAGVFTLVNSPRIVATLNDNTATGVVTITITSADSAVKWNGGASGNWDINNAANTIWQTVPSASTTYYIESGSGNDVALFDDTATGTTNVNLTTTLTPQSLTVSNTTKNYLFNGAGKITGSTGLNKFGSGTLTIANSGNNDFSGNLALNAGTLVISNTSSIGNTISGAGALTKDGNGTLTLSGDGSAFTGPVKVNGGTLTVLNTISLATASGITITNGGTLDIGLNSVALALEPITVSGSGVGGNGAIANSSGYGGGAVATSFQNLKMAADTTIGGPGRLDFRSTDPVGGADATLSTSGNAYKLTKVSVSTLQLSSVQIDAALGDIDVQGGTLSFQGNMPSLGNAANALTVFGGATVQFNSVGNELKKNLVLKDNGIVNNSAGANTFDGAVNLQGNGLFNIAGGGVTFTNVISGTGTLSKVTGTAALTLTAPNTYTGSTTISAGTLALTEPGDIRNSGTISIGFGATLDASGRADQTLTILAGHSLTGSGTLSGNLTNKPAGTVAPGSSTTIGTLTVSGNAVLNGTNLIKLVETNLTSDVLNVGGALQLGGTLKIVNLAGTLQSGDSFQIFNAGGGFSGNFTSISPASPGPGLAWDTNALATAGTLTVTGPGVNGSPTNIVSAFDGANLTLTWPADHTGWRLQVQTNTLASGLGTNWSDVAGSTGTNQVVIPVNPANGSVFYRMVYP
jgi:autotransporter-associated beta strand protein